MATRERKKPVYTAKAGQVRVPVYQYADGRCCVVWRKVSGEQQRRQTFTIKARAIEKADEMALAIANGQADVLELTHADRESYLLAKRTLEPLGVPLHDAIEQFAKARRALGDHTLMEAVDYFVLGRRAAAAPAKLSGAEILARLVASISDHPPRTMGEYRYRQGIRNDLAKFVAVHPRLENCYAQDIRDYLRGLGVGSRRRDNIRDEIVTLYRFARTKDGGELFPINAITEAEQVKRLKDPTIVTTYSPEELVLLLKFVSPRWLPWMATAAFSGARPSEILRFHWSYFKWNEKPEPRIAIPAFAALKVKKPRRAEFGSTLQRWLSEWRGAVGPLYENSNLKQEKKLLDELSEETSRLSAVMTKAIGRHWSWHADALRHSYGSYRYAQVKDFAPIASWMGNSPQVIRDRYYDSKSEDEANRWFGILPEDAANIIQGEFALA